MSEAAVSDLQVLCYYAYVEDPSSPGTPLFYDSRPEALSERTSLLGPDLCVEAQMNVQLPQQISGAASLSVVVQVPSDGRLAPAPNVLVDLTPTCASASPASGRTDASGDFSSTITPVSGCGDVSVDVTARGDSGTAVLAHKTVTATLGADYAGFITKSMVGTRNDGATIDFEYSFSLHVRFAADGTPTVVSSSGSMSENAASPDNCQSFDPPVSVSGSDTVTASATLSGGTVDGQLGAPLEFQPTDVSLSRTSTVFDPANGCMSTTVISTTTTPFPDPQSFVGQPVIDQNNDITAIDFTNTSSGNCGPPGFTYTCTTTGQLVPE